MKRRRDRIIPGSFLVCLRGVEEEQVRFSASSGKLRADELRVWRSGRVCNGVFAVRGTLLCGRRREENGIGAGLPPRAHYSPREWFFGAGALGSGAAVTHAAPGIRAQVHTELARTGSLLQLRCRLAALGPGLSWPLHTRQDARTLCREGCDGPCRARRLAEGYAIAQAPPILVAPPDITDQVCSQVACHTGKGTLPQ